MALLKLGIHVHGLVLQPALRVIRGNEQLFAAAGQFAVALLKRAKGLLGAAIGFFEDRDHFFHAGFVQAARWANQDAANIGQ